MFSTSPQTRLNAALVLADGTVFRGKGIGATGLTGGEMCFNTGMTGYQETLTDPSYAGQIITFTFPHIGNVGTNSGDMESIRPFAQGLVMRSDITEPSSYRAQGHLNQWLKDNGITGICGIDTRALTRHLRINGAQNGVIEYGNDKVDTDALVKAARALPSMNGLDIAHTVSTKSIYAWTEGPWDAATNGFDTPPLESLKKHVVVIDYGVKRNILRCLVGQGFRLTVVPAQTSAEDILAFKPDGIFLSNGPGDPAATGIYAVPVIQKLLKTGLPLFGICLGHQLLALALGGRTEKMKLGHRGANQPVKDLTTGKVEITSQNHGFHVIPDSLPPEAIVTHVSLFDGTNEGLSLKNQPVFSVQYHPEASPGPSDSHYLFDRFAAHVFGRSKKVAA